MSSIAAQKTKQTQLTQQQLQQIIELQSAIGSADFDLDSFMNIVVERVQAFTLATGAVVELVENDEMVYRAASGAVAAFVGLRLQMKNSLSGYCVHSGEIAICEDSGFDPRVDREACQRIKAVSMMVVPLLRKGKTVGVLKVISDHTAAFNEYDAYTLKLLAGLLGGALGQQIEVHGRRQLEDQLRYMAQYDSLTSLPNRSLFNDRLIHAIARNQRSDTLLAVMYMDIDYFKSVNDTYGHAVGDALLREFSSRVRAIVRASDTFARLGGDEFVLIAEQLKNKQEARQIADKIVEAVRGDFDFGKGKIIKVSSSIGVALSRGKEVDATRFLQLADTALYKAKKAGRDRFEFADS